MDHIPSGQYLTEKEKDKLKDAYKKGYGVTMPGEWAIRLINEVDDLKSALTGIIEIGKRDMSNPKYDGYFEHAKEVLAGSSE